MDPNAGNNEAVNDGIFAAVAEQNHETYASRGQLDKAKTDPAATGETGGGTPTKQKTQKPTDSDDDDGSYEGDNAEGLDEQDFSREPVPSTNEAPEEQTTETTDATSQTNTETQTEADDWKASLPADPGEFTLEPPKPDELGQIDPKEYGDYIRAQIRYENKVEEYNAKLITATFDTVEKILPEIKDDPALQAAIRNTYYGTLNADETVNVAKSLRQSLDKVASTNKSAGIQSAKTSISIQKNAAVETKGATQKKSPDSSKSDNLTKRLQKNDTSAFEELMGGWLEDGKV